MRRHPGELVTDTVAMPPNNGMELTGQKRHSLCKREDKRERRFCPAAHAGR